MDIKSFFGSSKLVKKCDDNKITNPETGKCVKEDGKKGKELLKNRILNPVTDNYVLKDTEKGRILKNDEKAIETCKEESQAHGFKWEKDILINVYGVTKQELEDIKYTSKMDLPGKFNKLDKANLSVKTTGSKLVCMGDSLRIFNEVQENVHLVVITYDQLESEKKVKSIVEIDLTKTKELLFGDLTIDELTSLDKLIKSVPQKRRPTEDERKEIYRLRDELSKKLPGYLQLNPKLDSSQSRLQCSFPNFTKFITENDDRVIEKSSTNEFRGGSIQQTIKSNKRVRKSKV